MIRKGWIWLTGVLGLLLLVASIPALWSLHIRQRIVARIQERHGSVYAVIAMHADGEPGFGVNMYAKLWDCTGYTWRNLTGGLLYRETPYGHHHCALLVADRTTVSRYHWSIRLDDLVLDERRPHSVRADPIWRWDPARTRIRHGLQVSDDLNDDAIDWYWPPGSLPGEPGSLPLATRSNPLLMP